jgi:hypothetical protein
MRQKRLNSCPADMLHHSCPALGAGKKKVVKRNSGGAMQKERKDFGSLCRALVDTFYPRSALSFPGFVTMGKTHAVVSKVWAHGQQITRASWCLGALWLGTAWCLVQCRHWLCLAGWLQPVCASGWESVPFALELPGALSSAATGGAW